MRINGFLKTLMFVLTLSLFVGCSSDDEDSNPTGPENGGDNPPTINVKTITVPQAMQNAANNGDPGAATAMTYINLANSLPAYAQFFNPPEGAAKLSSISAVEGEWTWTQDGATFTLTSTETTDSYLLTLTVEGTFNGTTYSGQKLMESTVSKDGNTGELFFYDPDAGVPALTFNWQIESDGTYHLEMVAGADYGGATVEMTINPDNSGTLNIDTADGGSWHIQWASDGSGSWTQYDAGGNPIDSGSWS
jgi:hypothetical protein